MTNHKMTQRTLTVIALVAVFAAGPIATSSGRVLAQGSNGSLVVTVKDQAGALISSANVTATNVGTAQATTAVSNETGVATFPLLPVGNYSVTVEAPNFQKAVFEQVVIDVGRTYGLVADLAPGAISESVTVTAGENIVSSTNFELTSTVTPEQVADLPLDGRNPLQLIQLQPGVTVPNGRAGVTINGQRSSSGMIIQDGIPIQDYAVRENALSFSPNRTTVSSVSEFSVTSQNAGADQSGASSIRLVTPSGTNDLHGEVFEYHRNDALGANDWFNNAAIPHIDRPQLIRNQFGFAVSGPVVIPNFYDGRNKLFFFGSYEGFRERSATPFTTEPFVGTTICLINQKGGCGKSSCCFHLGGALASMGRRVLLLDADPQGSLSQGFLGPARVEVMPMHDTLAACFASELPATNLSRLIQPTGFDRLDLICANQTLAPFNRPSPEQSGLAQFALQQLLNDFTGYDYVLMDCPPNLYQCSWNALLAADYVVIPVPPEDFGTQGLRVVQQAIDHARQLNPKLQLLGHFQV